MTFINVSVADGIATLHFNDPRRHNALSQELLTEFVAAFRGFGPEVRAIVIRAGVDDKTWCGGYNIRELKRGLDPLEPGTLLPQAFACMADSPAPVIGMIHGAAYGGGCDLALRCDIMVGDPTAALAFTPAKLGVAYDLDGIANLLLRAGPQITMEMFATANPMPGARLHALGVMNHLVPEAELESFTYGLARTIAANAPLSVACTKMHTRRLLASFAESLRNDPVLNAIRAQAANSDDFEEGVAALREKRVPVFTGR